ncbi:MAG: type I glyceraldehyde-3-phosphate dehydrogenase [Rhodobacteraceae bacterium]|nr:type I glyceraldehyde-3-phosphate dehydrogenase [Paracoccaceae bacterium]MCY4249294.1 type I glyceraldehyde-3-phosphate dehydrogenase [Paracoccaceae bacterium]
MTIKVGINGFGRIGRNVFRAIVESGTKEIEVVGINDLSNIDQLAHLFEFDSIHGRFQGGVSVEGKHLAVNSHKPLVSAVWDPENLSWQDVDIALECTGIFTSRDAAARHLQNGASKVIVSAPCTDADKTIVFGVNHQILENGDQVISNASCTTNCLSPVVKVINDAVGINRGFMTTIHSYTGDQPTLDAIHKDPYRARAAAMSMIPTTTGAARAVGLVLPELKGKLDGVAIRVPTPNVSVVDLKFESSRITSPEEINESIRAAAEGSLNGILGYTNQPNVSIDFNHDSRSSIFHMDQTRVMDGTFCRILSWYDNEWGFSNRMIDVTLELGKTI